MRNVSVVAIVALVGVLGFSAQAQAQGNDLTDVEGWWASLNCQYMVGAAVHSGAESGALFTKGTDGDNPDEQQWCKPTFEALALADRANLHTAVTTAAGTAGDANDPPAMITRKPSAEIISAKGWWNALTYDAKDAAVGGLLGLTDPANGTFVAMTEATEVAYDDLTVAQNARVNKAYEGLKKGATTMMPEPSPALPLVGLGILGLLLAGRGAYLRRRRA